MDVGWSRAKGPKRRSKAKRPQMAWDNWKPHNKFGLLAGDSDDSSDDLSDSEENVSTTTSPAGNVSNSNGNHGERETAQVSKSAGNPQEMANPSQHQPTPTARPYLPQPDPATPVKVTVQDPESEVDSAIHSGEEEPGNPSLQTCPLCNDSLEDLSTSILQHIRDHHTLTTPQPPPPPPAKPSPDTPEDQRCNITGRMTNDCIPTCIPGNHYAGNTMKLEEIRRRENMRRHEWEPHICGIPMKSSQETEEDGQDNYAVPTAPTLPTITNSKPTPITDHGRPWPAPIAEPDRPQPTPEYMTFQ